MARSNEFTINSLAGLRALIVLIASVWFSKRFIRVTVSTADSRTARQNRALHKYCQMLADELNAAGWDQKKVLTRKPEVDLPWSQMAVKENMWRVIQKAVTDKESTTEPKPDEYPKIYEVLNRYTATNLGISVPWPTNEDNGS